MQRSSTRASSKSFAVRIALPRSGSRKYSLRLISTSFETRLYGHSYAARFPKSSPAQLNALKLPAKLARQSLASDTARGKSGLHRAGCWVTPRRREATNRATETSLVGSDVCPTRVKRGNLHPEQHQIGGRRRGSPSPRVDGSSLGVTQGLEE